MIRYRDRVQAGQVLGDLLVDEGPGAVVLGIPRGGVVVAAAIALRLGGQLAAVCAVKVRSPYNPELAIGGVGPEGAVVLDAAAEFLDPEARSGAIADAVAEVRRRQQRFGPMPPMTGRLAVVVDDGVATGATLAAALDHAAGASPRRLVVAVPVGPPVTIAALGRRADRVVCPLQPPAMGSVGEWYDAFPQLTDAEVLGLLGR